MRKNLTDLMLRSVSAKGSERREIWDAKLPGFGVRVSPTGTKTFVLLYYFNGRKCRRSLGRFPFVSLADARGHAMTVLGQVANNIDPDAVALEPFAPRSVETVVQEFIEKHCHRHNRASTAYATERLLRKHFCKPWAGRDLDSISRRDVMEVLDAAMSAQTPGIANHALFAVRKFFNWCVERGIIETNPCLGVARPAPLNVRDRVLSDKELAKIWAAGQSIGYPIGVIVQLLILTAQRRGEVSGMRWTEVDTDQRQWTIPGERAKNKRTHVLPLSPIALDIVTSVPRLNPELVFPARGRETEIVSGFSKIKRKFDELVDADDWTFHDLRRTAATGMARLGVAPHIVERILNHSSGTFAGVAGVYNRFEYSPEMRAGLETWAAHVEKLIK